MRLCDKAAHTHTHKHKDTHTHTHTHGGDKVPAFDNDVARKTVEDELGQPIPSVFSEFSPRPLAAASLGQVLVCICVREREGLCVSECVCVAQH